MNVMRNMSISVGVLVASVAMAPGTGDAQEPPVVCCFSNPESVAWDPTSGRWFVSNRAGNAAGDGFISAVATDGTVEMNWVEGLNSPFGIAARDGTLYAADGNEVVAIDIESATILWKTPLTGSGANDLAVDPDSLDLYVSRTSANTIEVVRTIVDEETGEEQHVAEVFMSGPALASPNGLLVEDGILYIVNVSPSGSLRKVDLDDPDKEIVPITGSLGFLDGVQKLGPTFYLTDVISGILWRVGGEGETQPIPIGHFPLSADLGLDPERVMLGIPSGQNNGPVVFRPDPLPPF